MAVKRKKAGKRGADVNKAELIREILNSESGVRNRDVIATLKLRNVEVSPAQVSNVRKSLANRGGLQLVGRGGRLAAAARAGTDTVSLSALVAAKKLADSLGGLERARLALDALAQLR